MLNYNTKRVQYFSLSNYSVVFFYIDRVREILKDLKQVEPSKIVAINDAIELYECFEFVNNLPQVFETEELPLLKDKAKLAQKIACSGINERIANEKFQNLFEGIELRYYEKFWKLLSVSGAFKNIDKAELENVLNSKPPQIRYVLSCPSIVKKFNKVICDAMKSNAVFSAELLIGFFAAKKAEKESITLPKGLVNSVVDAMMLEYLASKKANLNYVSLLEKWPPKVQSSYQPSSEVRVTAKNVAKILADKIKAEGMIIKFATGLKLSFEQKACKAVEVTENGYTNVYSMEWLTSFRDPGTVLNNLIHVFELVDRQGLISMPAHRHEQGALLSSLGLHSKAEYPSSIYFEMRNNSALLAVRSYQKLLNGYDLWIEDALNWACNQYFNEEFGIDGFSINLPTRAASFLDKCKSIGPEIELILKEFYLYADRGCIDPDYLPYVSLKEFIEIPSLINNKYAVEGPKFEECSHVLFSDQSPLAYSEKHEGNKAQFFSLVRDNDVCCEDFPDIYQGFIDQEIERGLISVDESGFLRLTLRAAILFKIWESGAISVFQYEEEDIKEVGALVSLGCLSYSKTLFTPDEADYFSYVFNDAKFSDSLGLRNRYDHARYSPNGPNDNSIERDYHQLLLLLICSVLKINEELIFHFGKGGVEDFIDWPLIDKEKTIKAYKQLHPRGNLLVC